MKIGGLSLFTRASNGELHIAAYHPRKYSTWLWYLALARSAPPMRLVWRDDVRSGQWHDYLRLPFGRFLLLGRQDYHRRAA